jgi:hypothetical protein
MGKMYLMDVAVIIDDDTLGSVRNYTTDDLEIHVPDPSEIPFGELLQDVYEARMVDLIMGQVAWHLLDGEPVDRDNGVWSMQRDDFPEDDANQVWTLDLAMTPKQARKAGIGKHECVYVTFTLRDPELEGNESADADHEEEGGN